MMITRRDVAVALVSVVGTVVCGLAVMAATRWSVPVVAAQAQTRPIQGSATFDWNTFKINPTAYGSQRPILRAPTATLDELEMHITTLQPGTTSHEPHRHANEELIILREGSLETLSNGVWKPVGSGSVIFNASNDLHGVRNVGTTPATYHVVNWKSPGTIK